MTKKAKRKPWKLRRMTPEERRDFVLAYCNGTVWTDAHVRGDGGLLPMIFFPLVFVDLTKRETAQIGRVWADTTKDTTARVAINGMPMFFSCRFMHKDDWRDLAPKITEEMDRRKNFQP